MAPSPSDPDHSRGWSSGHVTADVEPNPEADSARPGSSRVGEGPDEPDPPSDDHRLETVPAVAVGPEGGSTMTVAMEAAAAAAGHVGTRSFEHLQTCEAGS